MGVSTAGIGATTGCPALTEMIRQGARRLLAEALEAEVAGFSREFQSARATIPILATRARQRSSGSSDLALKVPRPATVCLAPLSVPVSVRRRPPGSPPFLRTVVLRRGALAGTRV